MKNLTVKQKLIGMTIAVALLIGGLSLYFVNRFSAISNTYEQILQFRVPQNEVANAMYQVLLDVRINLNELAGVERSQENFIRFEQLAVKRLDDFKILKQAMLDGHPNLGKDIDGLEGIAIPPCRIGGQIESLTKRASSLLQDFKLLAMEVMDKKKQQLKLVNFIGWYDSNEDSTGVVKTLVETGRKLEALAKNQEETLVIAEMRRQEKNFLLRTEERYITRIKEAHRVFSAIATGEMKETGHIYYTAFESIFEKMLISQKLKDELKEMTRKTLREKQQILDEAIKDLKNRAHEQMVDYSSEAMAMANSVRTYIVIISFAVSIICLLFGWLISTGINKGLTRVINGLASGAEQVTAASSQVSSASQALAEGASEQAASLEETSSSLEELSSMTKQNAENSNQADSLMQDSNKVVGKANTSMSELTTSMVDISKASEETFKIIKTIDEIAFQTNLLALNAAVEAARAGEAGAGFAVVADEVRNLAMRAAEAAKNTANLIEETVRKINDGSEIVKVTNDAFSEVASYSAKVGGVLGEIAAASKEQAEGLVQVNNATVEIDKVTQQNAANAEESASAAEEMNAQANQMMEFVNDLLKMVDGKLSGIDSARIHVKTDHRAHKEHKALNGLPQKIKKTKAISSHKRVGDYYF